MKQLLLIRHAKSSWDDENIDDLDRPLNDRGKREAKALGILLKKKGLIPQLVISSPAKRAIKTAQKIVKKISYPKNKIEINTLIYSASIPCLIKLVCAIDKNLDQVFIVGHYPSLMELGNHLTDSNREKMSTCGFMLIEFKKKSWKNITKGSGNLVAMDKVQ